MNATPDPFSREERRFIAQFLDPRPAPEEYWAGHLATILPFATLALCGLAVGLAWGAALGAVGLIGYLLWLLMRGRRNLRLMYRILPTYERLLDQVEPTPEPAPAKPMESPPTDPSHPG